MFGRKRADAPPKPPQSPDPAAVARARREADALRETARELPEIDPADAKYW
jgi:hypothetical protein